jgi:hypothetical protein
VEKPAVIKTGITTPESVIDHDQAERSSRRALLTKESIVSGNAIRAEEHYGQAFRTMRIIKAVLSFQNLKEAEGGNMVLTKCVVDLNRIYMRPPLPRRQISFRQGDATQ